MSSFCKSYSHFFSKKFQHICISLDVNFNESLTNDIVSFEQLGPDFYKKIGSDISCKLSPKEIICLKCQTLFSGKYKKNTINLSSAA